MDFRASGKLMLLGEYLVMKGARCLAIPLKFNQTAAIVINNSDNYRWYSRELGIEYFRTIFNKNFEVIQTTDSEKAHVICSLLKFIFNQTPSLFKTGLDFAIDSSFPLEWGLGSSSTLVSLLSQWSGVDAYDLLENNFGGSGYDIACATSMEPILYEVKNRIVKPVSLPVSVTDKLLFVYTGNKQSTKQETRRFLNLEIPWDAIGKMNNLVEKSIGAREIEEFENCMVESENLLSAILGKGKIKDEKFPDYPWPVKSLGAWGGDFCMASFRDRDDTKEYFLEKGYDIQFSYPEIIYHQ